MKRLIFIGILAFSGLTQSQAWADAQMAVQVINNTNCSINIQNAEVSQGRWFLNQPITGDMLGQESMQTLFGNINDQPIGGVSGIIQTNLFRIQWQHTPPAEPQVQVFNNGNLKINKYIRPINANNTNVQLIISRSNPMSNQQNCDDLQLP